MQQIDLTYDAIHQAVNAFELPIQMFNIPWYAVARGALPFATMLAVKHKRRFGVIDPHEGFITPLHYVIDSDDPVLIIDDVVGSGRTMERVDELLKSLAFRGKVNRLVLVNTLNDGADAFILNGLDTYYHFPWEPDGV